MKRPMIPPQEISIIVRGLVVGAGETDERKEFTKRALESARRHLPGAQIILSTWKSANVEGLDYDDLVLTEQPEMIYTTLPDGSRFANSTNNQIVSTRAGLAVATRPYAVSMRSDIIFTGRGFADYFARYNEAPCEGFLKERIVVLPTFNAHKPIRFKFLFNTCDWFYFGLTEDIKNIFDIPLMDSATMKGEKVNGLPQQKENFGTEQYIWTNFLHKYEQFAFPNGYYYSEEALNISERSYAKNTIMVPADDANILCLKMPHSAYGASPILSSGLYTFNEYKRISNEYNQHKVPYFPNVAEELCYAIILRARMLVDRFGPGIYKSVVGRIRARRAAKSTTP